MKQVQDIRPLLVHHCTVHWFQLVLKDLCESPVLDEVINTCKDVLVFFSRRNNFVLLLKICAIFSFFTQNLNFRPYQSVNISTTKKRFKTQPSSFQLEMLTLTARLQLRNATSTASVQFSGMKIFILAFEIKSKTFLVISWMYNCGQVRSKSQTQEFYDEMKRVNK